MRKVFLLTLVTFILILQIPKAYSCGCGLAISEEKVFNALKETQAYLLIDIKDENTYNEMPFFRMVSMDEPYNVTIVFPIQGIPSDVAGKTITAQQFLNDYNINKADEHFKKQSFSGLIKKIDKDFEATSGSIFAFTNGIVPNFIRLFFVKGLFGMASKEIIGGLSPLAHFEFEGGTLDIYDVNSMSTLEEFVKTINITLTGEVQELVTKYQDYFVAVLRINVPSALNEDLRNQLSLCPEQTERAKQALQEKTEFNYEEIYELAEGPCRKPIFELIESVTKINSNVKGTLVDMKFENTDRFFYPVSIVNSYKYPITEQKYLIKTPSKLHIELESSKVDKTANFNSERWSKISSTREDISGKIIRASFGVRIGDILRSITQSFYNNTGWFVFIVYLLIIMLPLVYYHYKVDESLTSGELILTFGMFILGGLILSSLVMSIKKKRKFALILFLIWLLLLIPNIVF